MTFEDYLNKFFHHKPFPGKEKSYKALTDPGSVKKFSNIVQFAYFNDDLFAYLQDPVALNKLRDTIIKKYFGTMQKKIRLLIQEEREITAYQNILKTEPGKIKENKTSYRSMAFARTIREVYDYRCSACGLRLNLNGLVLIDAAHLIPFSVSYDDDPRNGIALCKNHHWAMDRFLIVPGTDNLWHVSSELDDRIEGCKEIINLNNRKILLPHKEKYYPKKESLHWRQERILK